MQERVAMAESAERPEAVHSPGGYMPRGRLSSLTPEEAEAASKAILLDLPEFTVAQAAWGPEVAAAVASWEALGVPPEVAASYAALKAAGLLPEVAASQAAFKSAGVLPEVAAAEAAAEAAVARPCWPSRGRR